MISHQFHRFFDDHVRFFSSEGPGELGSDVEESGTTERFESFFDVVHFLLCGVRVVQEILSNRELMKRLFSTRGLVVEESAAQRRVSETLRPRNLRLTN